MNNRHWQDYKQGQASTHTAAIGRPAALLMLAKELPLFIWSELLWESLKKSLRRRWRGERRWAPFHLDWDILEREENHYKTWTVSSRLFFFSVLFKSVNCFCCCEKKKKNRWLINHFTTGPFPSIPGHLRCSNKYSMLKKQKYECLIKLDKLHWEQRENTVTANSACYLVSLLFLSSQWEASERMRSTIFRDICHTLNFTP